MKKAGLPILSVVFIFLTFSCSIKNKNLQAANTYKLDRINFNIQNDNLRETMQSEYKTALNYNQEVNIEALKNERDRIHAFIVENVNAAFDKSNIQFLVDSTQVRSKYRVTAIIR